MKIEHAELLHRMRAQLAAAAQAMSKDLDEIGQDCAAGRGPPPSFADVNTVEHVQKIIGDLDAVLDRATDS
jgi:hypothetical protein